jgi:hypothetical protein
MKIYGVCLFVVSMLYGGSITGIFYTATTPDSFSRKVAKSFAIATISCMAIGLGLYYIL